MDKERQVFILLGVPEREAWIYKNKKALASLE